MTKNEIHNNKAERNNVNCDRYKDDTKSTTTMFSTTEDINNEDNYGDYESFSLNNVLCDKSFAQFNAEDGTVILLRVWMQ